MRILAIEPFFSGSHKAWLEGFAKHSEHDFTLLTLPANFWKWRMQAAAIELAREFNKLGFSPDLILATDMLDLPYFLAATRAKTANIPVVLYFHENQFTYPWSATDRDFRAGTHRQFALVNYKSALVADAVFFNSQFHKNSFFSSLKLFLKSAPDFRTLDCVDEIEAKSKVLYVALDLARFDTVPAPQKLDCATILWNHRWDDDKNPFEFVRAIEKLLENDHNFNLIICGESTDHNENPLDRLKIICPEKIVHWGYVSTFESYARLLKLADILPVTSVQDFFGISFVEACYCKNFPLVPQRLAYPELLGEGMSEFCLYTTFDDLVIKLRAAILNIGQVRALDFSSHFARFDWSNMISTYDLSVLIRAQSPHQ